MAFESTLYKTIQRLQDIAQRHKLVNSVRVGMFGEIDTDYDLKSTMVYIIPDSAFYPEQGKIKYRFLIHCMDALLPDRSNLITTISDCQGILNDIYVAFLYESEGSWGDVTGTYRFYEDTLKDLMAGCELELTINSFNNPCSENLPLNT